MRDRLEQLEETVLAQQETIDILMDAAERRQRLSNFSLFESNLVLEKLVERKTSELNRLVFELKAAQAQLLHSEKLEAIGRLASGVAHEINTPMQFIGDNLHFLRMAFDRLIDVVNHLRDAVGTSPSEATAAIGDLLRTARVDVLAERVPRSLKSAEEGVATVSGIVQALKGFAHPGSGVKAAEDLNLALQTTLTVSRNAWKYVAEIVLDLDPDLPLVPCHISELNQVFLNLVINAAQAIEDKGAVEGGEPGRITVSTSRSEGCVEVRIADTGGGIPAHVQDRIFEPFFTTKEVGRGSGQGLAIARSIVVDKHRGTIQFETGGGTGTTFVIRLPLTERGAAEGGANA